MAKFNSDGGGGGGVAVAAPAPASSAAPTVVASPAPAAPSVAPEAAPAPATSSAAAQGSTERVIDSLPTRNSPEYWQAFDALTPEKRMQVENEWNARDSGSEDAPAKPAEADPAAKPLPGDTPKADEDLFITSEDLAKADPKVRQVVETMQQRLDEFSPFMEENFGNGMQIFMNDPIIKQRMDEIATGNPWAPGELAKTFNPSEFITAEALNGLDPISDPEGFTEKLTTMLQQAHEKGLKNGQTAEQFKTQQQVAFAERKSMMEGGFNALTDAHPELKGANGITDMRNPQHPMNPFVKWAASNLGDKYFLNPANKAPFESAYAAFLASSGSLNQAIGSTVKQQLNKFIRNLSDAQKTAATVGRDTPSATPPQASPVPNLDIERYRNDPNYARNFYDSASQENRLKLEQLRYGNRV